MGGTGDLGRELAESRAREAALAEVLGVMRRAPGERATTLEAVLETVAVNAVRLCAADNGSIARLESDGWRLIANAGDIDRESLEKNWGSQPIEPNRRSLTGRVLLEKRTVTIVDAQADPEYDAGAGLFDVRSIIGVPLTRGDDIVGVLILRRGEPKPFTPEEIHLLETFADQASIAIENVRLFDETKESLDRQTAIGEVLRTISSSAFQLTPVLEAVAKHAARLCDARDVIVWRTVGDAYVLAVGPQSRADPVARIVDNRPIPIGLDTIVGRAHMERQPIQVLDIAEYYRGASGRAADLARLGGIKTLLAVPLIRDEKVLGVISLTRPELRPFSDEQIGLVRTFADPGVDRDRERPPLRRDERGAGARDGNERNPPCDGRLAN